MAKAKIVSRNARPLLVVAADGGATTLEVGVDEAELDAEAKMVSRVTLLLELGAGAAKGMGLENNLCNSDTVPVVAVDFRCFVADPGASQRKHRQAILS